MLISAQNAMGTFMSSVAVNIGDLVARYKAAKNKDEEAIAIIDIARQTQEEAKHEIAKELQLQDFATKQDLMAVKMELKEEMHQTKFSAIAWILTGIWLPLLLGVGLWFLEHR